jgi:hypothetical protein
MDNMNTYFVLSNMNTYFVLSNRNNMFYYYKKCILLLLKKIKSAHSYYPNYKLHFKRHIVKFHG